LVSADRDSPALTGKSVLAFSEVAQRGPGVGDLGERILEAAGLAAALVPVAGIEGQRGEADLVRRTAYSVGACSFWNVSGPRNVTPGRGAVPERRLVQPADDRLAAPLSKDVVAVPVRDMPESETALVWLGDAERSMIRAFVDVAAGQLAT